MRAASAASAGPAHVERAIDAHGEIHVAGTASAVTSAATHVPRRFATGDLGHLDADGFLYVDGRRKNMFITCFGRNVSPEWVEAELCERARDRASRGVRRSAAVERRGHRAGADGAAQSSQAAIDASNRRCPTTRASALARRRRALHAGERPLDDKRPQPRAPHLEALSLAIDALYDEPRELTA